MYSYYSRNEPKVTKREVLFSFVIIVAMFIIGFLIHWKISDSLMEKQQRYEMAAVIDNKEQFSYGMRTDIGDAFVYGDLIAVDTVTYPELSDDYMYVEKIKERYTEHTRTVTYTTGSGKSRQTHTRVEHYWTWDKVGEESQRCKELSFCGIVFDSNQFEIPSSHHIDTIKESSKIRYKYYGVDTKFTGTIFTELIDNNILQKNRFYNDTTIEELKKVFESDSDIILFWIFWILLTGGLVFGFCYLDNRWLEDK